MSDSPKLFRDTAPYVRQLIELPKASLISNPYDKLCLMGSCFTWHMHDEALRQLGLNSTFQWPTGFHFSTESLANLLERIASGEPHSDDDLYFYPDEIGGFRPFRYYFNQRFPIEQKEAVFDQLKALDTQCVASLKSCTHLMLVTGTPRVVRMKKNGECVTVTAQMPHSEYEHKRNTVEEEIAHLERFVDAVRALRGGNLPTMIFMLSPMRYMFHPLCAEDCQPKDTEQCSPFVEDNLGKAILRVALQSFLDKHPNEDFHYFPGYELVIDELRSHEPFCGDHAHVPHFPHVSHYVVKRFVESLVSPLIVRQLELAEQIHKLTGQIKTSMIPAQTEAMFTGFLEKMLPELCGLVKGTTPNAAVFRKILLLLGAGAAVSPVLAKNAFESFCKSMIKMPTIAIWGVGGNYESEFSAAVTSLEETGVRFVLTDGNPDTWDTKKNNIDVVAPEELAEIGTDYVFIASYYHDDIHARIRELEIGAGVA